LNPQRISFSPRHSHSLPISGARGVQAALQPSPAHSPQAAASLDCPAFIWPSPSAVPFNTKSQQDPNTILIKQQEVY